MPKHYSGTKSPASMLLEKEHKMFGIPKQMGKRMEGRPSEKMDHAASEEERKRTEVY